MITNIKTLFFCWLSELIYKRTRFTLINKEHLSEIFNNGNSNKSQSYKYYKTLYLKHKAKNKRYVSEINKLNSNIRYYKKLHYRKLQKIK